MHHERGFPWMFGVLYKLTIIIIIIIIIIINKLQVRPQVEEVTYCKMQSSMSVLNTAWPTSYSTAQRMRGCKGGVEFSAKDLQPPLPVPRELGLGPQTPSSCLRC